MESSDQKPTKSVENVFDTNRNITDLVQFVEVLRNDSKADLSYRDTFFKHIKQYIG